MSRGFISKHIHCKEEADKQTVSEKKSVLPGETSSEDYTGDEA